MARVKVDGVIESLRYGADGKILLVRLYERRGAVWSDHVLLDRGQLIGRLQQGRRYVTGTRTASMGSLLKTGLPVRLVGGAIVTEGQAGGRDVLAQVPLF